MLAPYQIETEDIDGATDIVGSRSRQEALAYGEQFLLTADPDLAWIATDEGFDTPIYVTKQVWDLLEEVKDKPEARRIRAWLILRPAKLNLNFPGPHPRYFTTIITRAPDDRYHPMVLVVGQQDFDDYTPVITIAFQGEER